MPAKKKAPESVTIRMAVMVDLEGNWAAYPVNEPDKYSDAAACEESAFGDCAYDISDAEGAAKYIVTATLPVPKPQPAPEVKGEVSAPTPPVEKPAKKGKK